MNYVQNQNGKVPSRRNASRFRCRCRENNIEMTSTLFQNEAPSFASSSQISPHSSVNREYYQWLCRLRLHIQVGRLPVQGTWQGLVIQSDNEGPCNLHVKLTIVQ